MVILKFISKKVVFFPKNEQVPSQNLKFILKKQKTVLHMVILEFTYPDPQLHQIFKPIRLLFCRKSSCSDLS